VYELELFLTPRLPTCLHLSQLRPYNTVGIGVESALENALFIV